MIICPICDNKIDENFKYVAQSFPEAVPLFNRNLLIRYKCEQCQLVFGPLDIIDMSHELLNQKYIDIYKINKETYNVVDYFNFYSLNPQREKIYLNIACGETPYYISDIKQDGFNLFGNDIALKEESDFLYTDINKCPIKKFDGIITHNYMEHVQKPIDWFKEMNALMNIGDKMIHSTTCFGYIIEFSPFHLYFYSPQSLEILANKTGFHLERLEKFKLQTYDGLNKDNMIIVEDSTLVLASSEAIRCEFEKIMDV